MIFTEGFMGESPINVKEYYNRYDTKDGMEEIAKLAETNPAVRAHLEKYKGYEIVYYRNKLGHRSREIEDLDFNNYILCVGCSMTEGIAIRSEDRFSDVIEKETGIHTYNMGLAGTGHDILLYNLTQWKLRFPDPKILICQWSNKHFAFSIQDYPWGNIIFDKSKYNTTEWIKIGNELNIFNSRAILAEKTIRSLFPDTFIVNLHPSIWDTDYYGQDNKITWSQINPPSLARDGFHYGPEANRQIALEIIEKILPYTRSTIG